MMSRYLSFSFWNLGVFFFFKQKTEYEVGISDWSSDVCSSDLAVGRGTAPVGRGGGASTSRHCPSVSAPRCHLPMASPQGGFKYSAQRPQRSQREGGSSLRPLRESYSKPPTRPCQLPVVTGRNSSPPRTTRRSSPRRPARRTCRR